MPLRSAAAAAAAAASALVPFLLLVGTSEAAATSNSGRSLRANAPSTRWGMRRGGAGCVAHTYYDSLEGGNDEQQQAILALWNETWTANGWTTRVLSRKDAEQHKEFEDMLEAFDEMPAAFDVDKTINDHTKAGFLRWVAMSQMPEAGFLVDYDVMNLGFKPATWCAPGKLKAQDTLTLFEKFIPSLTYGSPEVYGRLAKRFSKGDYAVLAAEWGFKDRYLWPLADVGLIGWYGRFDSVTFSEDLTGTYMKVALEQSGSDVVINSENICSAPSHCALKSGAKYEVAHLAPGYMLERFGIEERSAEDMRAVLAWLRSAGCGGPQVRGSESPKIATAAKALVCSSDGHSHGPKRNSEGNQPLLDAILTGRQFSSAPGGQRPVARRHVIAW